MSWWDRYQAWQLQSRAHYVATAVGLRALIVFLLGLYAGSSAGRALLLTAIFAVVGTLVYGWFWYPRVKAKSQQTSAPTRGTHV